VTITNVIEISKFPPPPLLLEKPRDWKIRYFVFRNQRRSCERLLQVGRAKTRTSVSVRTTYTREIRRHRRRRRSNEERIRRSLRKRVVTGRVENERNDDSAFTTSQLRYRATTD